MAASKSTKKRSSSSNHTTKSKSTSHKRSTSSKAAPKASTKGLEEAAVIGALAFSVLLFLADINLLGSIGPFLKSVNMGLFGCMGYIMPILFFLCLCFLISNSGSASAWARVGGLFLILLSMCAFMQLFSPIQIQEDWTLADYYTASKEGLGGGILGGFSFLLLMKPLGAVGLSVVMAVILVFGIMIVTGWSLLDFLKESSYKPAPKPSKSSTANTQKRREEIARARLEEREAKRQRDHEERLLRSRQKTEQLKYQTGKIQEQAAHLAEAKKTTEQKNLSSSRDLPLVSKTKPYAEEETSFNGKIFFGDEYYREETEQEVSTETPNPAASSVNAVEKENEKQHRTPLFHFDKPITWQKKESEPIHSPVQDEEDVSPVPIETNKPEIEEITPDFELDPYEEAFDEQDALDEQHALDDIFSFESTDLDDSLEDFAEFQDVFSEEEELDSVFQDKKSLVSEETSDSEYKTVVTASGKVITVELDGIPGQKNSSPKTPETKDEVPIPIPSVPEKEYEFPSYQLLKKGSGKISRSTMDRELRETASKLQQTLRNFGVGVTVTNVSCGPSVTRYELQPEQGVKVSKITSLADDIKLNLAAADIRIEAPVPGKSVIGIEVPNKENSTVTLRELLESPAFCEHKSHLAFAVGKDIGGQIIIGDISKMPHLLIAGATGSGKSVCINTMIMSLIYKSKPTDVKMLMIDPKVVELSVYNGIPHLLFPVITDAKKATGALNWAVAEMTSRYEKFAECSVRDMASYNRRIDQLTDVPEEEKPEKMPHIVIIIDELADLMMVSSSEVEDAIIRLAQLARAAGIHLIIATQRPSVNVITGLIKANIPSRIAFAVSSGTDSRTILDMVGAEKLLGKGDMLYYPQGMPKPIRIQGAFVSDAEVSAVVESISSQGDVAGGKRSSDVLSGSSDAFDSGKKSATDRDELFLEAGKFIIEKEKASIGALQRMFKIGFNRAARIMDQLAEAGVVGEEEGTKPRKILMSQEEFSSWIDEYY